MTELFCQSIHLVFECFVKKTCPFMFFLSKLWERQVDMELAFTKDVYIAKVTVFGCSLRWWSLLVLRVVFPCPLYFHVLAWWHSYLEYWYCSYKAITWFQYQNGWPLISRWFNTLLNVSLSISSLEAKFTMNFIPVCFVSWSQCLYQICSWVC